MVNNLEKVIAPTSIAVLGASNKEKTVGNAVIDNILRSHFTGRVYPVNPSYKEVLGLRCYSNVLEIEEAVDLAVVITPRDVVPKVVEECGKKGVKGAVIISSGFKEVGEEGAIIEKRITAIAKQYGIRIIGPNCLGFINAAPSISLNASFTKGMPKFGNIMVVSQSGAICAAMLEYAKTKNIGFSKVFSLGNKADIDENDILHFTISDKSTRVVLMYIEDLTNGRRFIESALQLAMGENETKRSIPIIALKAGKSSTGAKAIASHTGALAGSEEAYNAIFEQAGIVQVDTLEEMFDHAVAFAYQGIPKSDGTAVVSNGGGPAAIIADAASKYDLKLTALSNSTVNRLKSVLPRNASIINPIDMVGDADHQRYEKTLRIVLEDPDVHSCVVASTPQLMLDLEALANVITSVSKEFEEKPILASIMAIAEMGKISKILDENNIPQYPFPESAAKALAAMNRYQRWLTKPRADITSFDVDKIAVKEIFDNTRKDGRNYVHEYNASLVLKAYGIPVAASAIAINEEECTELSKQIGYPVVLKISSPDIVHKVDVGGVELGLRNEDEVKQAFHRIIDRVKTARLDANIQGVNVQEFVKGGKEVIIGMKRDPQFGPMIMFGSGGIYVSVYNDVSFRLAPITKTVAQEMIESTKAFKLLSGIRGEKPSDIESVVECLQRISQLALEFPEILEIDINPLRVFEKGCKAVDARMVIS